MSTVIEVANLSKAYQLGEFSTGALSHDLQRSWAKLRGKEDPFLKVGETNDRTTAGQSNMVWSLKDIDFTIPKGETVGIIGRNGAGKSTLLKILSRITAPTRGSIKVKGRIASILEVGTGFHAELTGRENIYLNGAILGMRKAEITRKLDEIIAFSGVERYIDTPVKRYSSGMYVRLAFAVAANLESEILIVDEVLAVGDAEFQRKCLGKMDEVSKGDGRTILFVSHNLAAVKSLCKKGIVLNNGKLLFNGEISASIGHYLKGNTISLNRRSFGEEHDLPQFALHKISLNAFGHSSDYALDENQQIEIHTVIGIKYEASRLHLTYVLSNQLGEPLFTFSHIHGDTVLQDGDNHLTCTLPKGFLNIGSYYLSFYLIRDKKEAVFVEKDILSFDVQEGERGAGEWLGREPGFIKPVFDWQVERSLSFLE